MGVTEGTSIGSTRGHLDLEDDARAAGGLVGVIDHFHLVREVVHAGDGGEEVEAEFIAKGGGNFDQAVLIHDPAAIAGARVCSYGAGKALCKIKVSTEPFQSEP